MTNVLIRIGGASNFLKFKTVIRETNKKLFSKYLLITNLTISTTFSGLGDFLEQSYEIAAGYQKSWDRMRTLKLGSTGLPVGLVYHYWFIFLDRHITGRTGKFLIKKLLMDQFIGSPLYIIVFFLSLGVWNGWSKKELKHEICTKGVDLYTAEWIVWPPAQTFNFYFLPTRFRLLYDSIISLGFDTYFSYVTHKDKREIKSVATSNEIQNKQVKS